MVYIIHGMPSKEEYLSHGGAVQSKQHWIPWIKEQLIQNGFVVQTPEMPEPYEPDYGKWKSVFEQFEINDETVLIGHSGGGGFLMRWLSEHKVNVGKVILVAPWIDLGHRELASDFFDFTIEDDLVSRTKGITIIYSTDDDASILETVKILKEKLPKATFQEFTDKGHFVLDDMGTNEFPELLTALLS